MDDIKLKVFIYFCILVSFFRFVTGAVRFTHHPPSVLYVQTGQTVRFVWGYTVEDRYGELTLNSPRWDYYDSKNKRSVIGYEDGQHGWKWTIANQCPARLSTRVSIESTATLVISNVTTADNGGYGCTLLLLSSSPLLSKVQLIVTVRPQFSPQPPLIKNIAEGKELNVPCTAVGPPTPNITWVQIVGGVTRSTGTGSATLKIINIRRDQNGSLYECQARNNPTERPVIAQTMIVVYYPPQTTVTSQNITVVQGNEILLSCTADGYPPPSISWTKTDGDIKAGHTDAGGTLRIPDAIKTDAGKYICTAKNTYDSREHVDKASATVTVKYQPSIMLDKLKNHTLNESDSLTIKCDADGYPPPVIKWKTPTGPDTTGNVYNIPSVSRSHAGTYKCTASNGIGRKAMASIQVTVQFKSIIDESRSSSQTSSWNGNSICLKCFATGLPAPLISWYKPTNQQITTSVNIVPGGSEVTVLTTTDPGDYGQYKCRATNILGSDVHIINVTQLFPPGPVTITINEIEASSIKVSWTKPAADGGSPITGYKVEVNSTKASVEKNKLDTRAVITKLVPNTRYLVNVSASNAIGDGVVSTSVFSTLKKGPPGVPELTAIVDTTGLSVRLTWTKPDDNGGEITKYTIYMKKEGDSEWIKADDVTDLSTLEYNATKNIEYGKTYKFIVTAWNEHGESIKEDVLGKIVTVPLDKPTSAGNNPNKDKRTSGNGGSDGSVIGIAVGAVLFMLIVAVILGVIIIRKKGLLSKGFGRKSSSNRAAYDNDIDPDSAAHQAAAADLGGADDGIPTYAAVDLKKKTKKPAQDDIANYAVVDKSKKKRPGEIIYAELADFNTAGSAAAAGPRPITYTGTDYADISQFQKQDEAEPTYANFPGRGKNYTNIQGSTEDQTFDI